MIDWLSLSRPGARLVLLAILVGCGGAMEEIPELNVPEDAVYFEARAPITAVGLAPGRTRDPDLERWSARLERLSPAWHYGELDSPREVEMLGMINAVAVLRAGQVAVLDVHSARVLLLDAATGELAAAFGSPGRGPGEFFRPAAVGEDDGGGLWVSDGVGRLQSFSLGQAAAALDGEARLTVPIAGLCAADSGMIVHVRSEMRPELFRLVPWTALRAEGEIEEFASRDGMVSHVNPGFAIHYHDTRLDCTRDGRVVAGHLLFPAVRVYARDGAVSREIRFRGVPGPPPPSTERRMVPRGGDGPAPRREEAFVLVNLRVLDDDVAAVQFRTAGRDPGAVDARPLRTFLVHLATGDGLYAGELDAGLGTLVGHVANHELLLFAREEPFPRLRAMSYAN